MKSAETPETDRRPADALGTYYYTERGTLLCHVSREGAVTRYDAPGEDA